MSGNLIGVLLAALFSYLLGFTGPFAFCGNIYLLVLLYFLQGVMFFVLAVFQNCLVTFIPEP